MNSNHKPERRRFSRIGFDATAVLSQEGREFIAKVVDISVNGILVETPQTYRVRTDLPCGISIRLAESIEIRMQASLVHSSDQFLGFHCSSIDMESITHLRRLVEINLNDPSASDRVLAELLKRHEDYDD